MGFGVLGESEREEMFIMADSESEGVESYMSDSVCVMRWSVGWRLASVGIVM